MLSKSFFDRLGKKVIKMYKAHIFDRATDIRGNRFKGYSPKYGAKKRAGQLTGQFSGSASTTAPMVTKAFYNDLKLRNVSTKGFRLKWSSRGERVNHLAKMGRVVTTDDQPFPTDVVLEIDRQFRFELGRLGKSRRHRITLGKKISSLGKIFGK